MTRARRFIAALAVALLCAPGTWLRTDTPRIPPKRIVLINVAGAGENAIGDWTLEGVWQARADNRMFGGFSALMALRDERFQAFSDRGVRLTMTQPDRPAKGHEVIDQPVAQGRQYELFDIESATRDPATGDYWLGFENAHVIHRFSAEGKPGPLRDLTDEVDWYSNAGMEAIARLADGRFVIVPEGSSEGLVFAGDPTAGAPYKTFQFEVPAKSYAVTDMAQLPDGRLLLLLRNVAYGVPPFASLIAIADPPRGEQAEVWKPQITLDLTRMIPPENYEGMAVRPRADGKVAVWLISDDNFSVMQRTLIAKLIFDPRGE